jgi:hypothetical protein
MTVTAAPGTWWSERRRTVLAAVVLIAALVAFGVFLRVMDTGLPQEEESGSTAALVEHVDGSDIARLTLVASAIKRLDLQTAATESARVAGAKRLAVPYAAVVYDAEGGTWVYTSSKPRTFMRQPITIDRIEGSRAILSAGPGSGTQVVTVGAQELWGAELGIDAESH